MVGAHFVKELQLFTASEEPEVQMTPLAQVENTDQSIIQRIPVGGNLPITH